MGFVTIEEIRIACELLDVAAVRRCRVEPHERRDGLPIFSREATFDVLNLTQNLAVGDQRGDHGHTTLAHQGGCVVDEAFFLVVPESSDLLGMRRCGQSWVERLLERQGHWQVADHGHVVVSGPLQDALVRCRLEKGIDLQEGDASRRNLV